MKVCNDYRLLIQLYIDGELSAEERQMVEAHLSVCPACRRYCDEICMVNRAVQDVEIPKDLHAGIMAAVAAERAAAKVIDFPETKAKKRPARRWIGTVAAMLAVACVGLFGMESGMASVFSGMTAKSADTAETVVESTMETARLEEKSVEQKMSAAESAPEAPQEYQAIRIEETTASWFADNSDHVDVMNCNVPAAMNVTEPGITDEELPDESVPEEDTADEGSGDLNDSRIEALAAMMGDSADDYGFCLVTAGSIEQLPAVFADQAKEAVSGFTLVITVRNDPQVYRQIEEIMAACGFEVQGNTAQWFPVCTDAAEGLVIVDLTE